MLAINIILLCLSLIIYVAGGLVCGMICIQIVRSKNVDANEVVWFWAGFLFNVIAVFMTLAVKDKNK